MKIKIRNLLISFISIILINIIFSPTIFWDFGMISGHVGLLYVLGLLLGPYGTLGAVIANILIDFYNGFSVVEIIPSAVFTFGISYLSYKLWYSGFRTNKITKPRLDNIYHLLLFLSTLSLCGFIYSTVHANLFNILIGEGKLYDAFFYIYFFNFINIAFIFGILSIGISKKIDFIYTPKKSEKPVNRKLYRLLFYSLIISISVLFLSLFITSSTTIIVVELIIFLVLLFGYLTKPFEYEIESSDDNTIIEKIIQNFLIITLFIAILGVFISFLSYGYIINLQNVNVYFALIPGFIITDLVLIIFFIPSIFILRYIENKVIHPISSFSGIKAFIKENEKIEAEGLVNIYSKYIRENNEIGTLARAYTDLINHNNNYIESIHEIESEKKRVETELNVATKIQESSLPTKSIETDEFMVNGYCKAAKGVGGDFLDYYMLDDDHLAVVIGDASGKGVPAALLAMTTQVIIKQILNHSNNPSEILFSLNNQLCENNSESMFLTLWLGIYNKTNNKLIFSNAGHNPPLIKENGKFKYLDIDSGLVLGIIGDFDYINEEVTVTEEMILYTDGITDANNNKNEMFSENRLLKFFNEFKSDDDPIDPLLDTIHNFTEDENQFDDMTLLHLKIKQ